MQPVVLDARVLESRYAEYGTDFEAIFSLSSDEILMGKYLTPVRGDQWLEVTIKKVHQTKNHYQNRRVLLV